MSISTGMWLVAGVVLILRQHSRPSITGIMTSQMMMSGTVSCALRRPSSPLAALRTRYLSDNNVRRKRRMSELSSMMSAMGLGSSSLVVRSSCASSMSRSRADGRAFGEPGLSRFVKLLRSLGMKGMVCWPSAIGLAGRVMVKTEPVPVG